jgi:hypothetical protein
MRRLSTMIRPMSMQWTDLGCSYNTSTGMRTVLKVGASDGYDEDFGVKLQVYVCQCCAAC